MIKYEQGDPLLVTQVEELESNEVGNIYTKHEAVD